MIVVLSEAQMPLAICAESTPADELRVWNDDALFQRQLERVRAVEVPAISADDVVTVWIRDIDVDAIEDVAGVVGAGALEGFEDRGTYRVRDWRGFGLQLGWRRELVRRDRFTPMLHLL